MNTILTDDEIKAECRVGFGIDPVLDGNLIKFGRAIEAAVLAKLAQQADRQRVPQAFTDWLCREMPPGTIISDPAWWAPKIARAMLAAAPEAPAQAPIDMVLFCPACGTQHIDAPEECPDSPGRCECRGAHWKNPPHRSHLCHGCGHIWRPADVPTNGVSAIKTKGKADSPVARSTAQPTQAEAPAQASAVDERDRQDAERYRHLVKEGDGRIYTDPHGIIIWNFPKNKKGICDSAIDAHIQARAALAQKGGAA